MSLANNNNQHEKLKHVDLHSHFTKKVVKDGHIELCYVPIEKMVADVLTKSLLAFT